MISDLSDYPGLQLVPVHRVPHHGATALVANQRPEDAQLAHNVVQFQRLEGAQHKVLRKIIIKIGINLGIMLEPVEEP